MVDWQIVAKQEVSPMKRAFWAMALSFGLGAAGANAATMQAVYSGFVVGGYDQTGVFGAPDTDLDNMGFALTMIYNTQTGNRETTSTGDLLTGGSVNGAADPFLQIIMTINGISKTMTGAYDALIHSRENSGFPGSSWNQTAVDFVQDMVTGSYTQTYVNMSAFDRTLLTFPNSLDTAFTATGLLVEPTGYGNFAFNDYDNVTGLYTRFTGGTVYLDSMTVTQLSGSGTASGSSTVSPVPLPAAGALLLAAMGSLALFRRRVTGVNAA
jgi:hypothetical protein